MKRFISLRLSGLSLTAILLVVVSAALLLCKLGSLTHGLAVSEQQLPSVHASVHTLIHNPSNAPYTIAQLLIALVLPGSGFTASRLPNVLIAAIITGLLYWLLKQWYGRRLALFGVALLITSPWLLHVARLADPGITSALAMTTILALAAAWHKKTWSRPLLYVTVILCVALIYIPGGVWLVAGAVVIERKALRFGIQKYSLANRIVASLVGCLLLLPLILQLVASPKVYRTYLGWPHGLASPLTYMHHFVAVWQYIFVGGLNNPLYNVGTLALLNILMTLAFVVGLRMYGQHWRATRTQLLVTLWIIGTALAALASGDPLVLLPIVIVLVSGGIGYLLHLWLKVFPRNPYARSFGIGLMALVVVFAVVYNLRNYYVAWPHTEAVRGVFTRKL